MHISEGWGYPNINRMAKLEQVLKGIKSAQAKGQGPSKKKRLPVTLDILSKLRGVWQQVESGSMLWAAASLCFFGFLRSGEITIPSDTAYDEGAHLNFNDVAVDGLENPKMLRLRIKADPFRVGVDIFVGRTGTPLCPVEALLIYMGPLFRFRDGRPLTRTRFVAKVKGALTTAGVDQAGYSGHSFRIGAATTAAHQGISDATLGRWKSNAYQLYIRTPREQLAAVSQQLVQRKETVEQDSRH